MKETAEESAELKQAFKKDTATAFLQKESKAFPLEWDEAVTEVETGLDTCAPASLVALYLQRGAS